MTTRFQMAIPGALADSHARASDAVLLRAIASRWTELRSAWTRSLARRRLGQSIAHLDDRLLADIGLGPQDLGFAERFARRHAVQQSIRSVGKTNA
jgi:uncharacterized protein YjiS (DUF1127 family)